MAVITSLAQAKRSEHRVNVFLDGQFWVGLDKNEVLHFGLFKGKELFKDEQTAIEKSSHFTKLKERVANYLQIRPRSKKEVRDYLLFRKKIDPAESEIVISYFTKKGLINDRAFAQWFATNRLTFGVHGETKIRTELLKKGVERKIIDEVVKMLTSDEALQTAQEEKLNTYLKKIIKSVNAKDKYELKRKVFARLISRGFKLEEITKAWGSLVKS